MQINLLQLGVDSEQTLLWTEAVVFVGMQTLMRAAPRMEMSY